jgi:hypothetical protein
MKRVLLTAIFLSCVAGNAASAAGMHSYRCRDAQGKLHVSGTMPPECQGRDTEVLNEHGTVTQVLEGEASRAKTLAREAEEAQRLKERNAQLQRDRVLLDTYLAVSDIERLRDQRLELLDAQLKVTEQHIGTLQERLNQLRQQSARFKPYNDKTNAPPLPDHIAEALVITVKSIAVDRETMQTKKNEQVELTASFERDIKRFQELKAMK